MPRPAQSLDEVVRLGNHLVATASDQDGVDIDDWEACLRTMMAQGHFGFLKRQTRLGNDALERLVGADQDAASKFDSGRGRKMRNGKHLPTHSSVLKLVGRCRNVVENFYQPLWLSMFLEMPIGSSGLMRFRKVALRFELASYWGNLPEEKVRCQQRRFLAESLPLVNLVDIIGSLRLASETGSPNVAFLAKCLHQHLLMHGCELAAMEYGGLLFRYCVRHLLTLPGCPQLHDSAEVMAAQSALVHALAYLRPEQTQLTSGPVLQEVVMIMNHRYGPTCTALFQPAYKLTDLDRRRFLWGELMKRTITRSPNKEDRWPSQRSQFTLDCASLQRAEPSMAQWLARICRGPIKAASWIDALTPRIAASSKPAANYKRTLHRLVA